jgi:tripartite-type tricarboxylate transporter receptor subunit TctC
VRPLGASGAARIPSLPNVPTMTELGFSARFSFSGFSGLLAPMRTPQPILAKLTDTFRIAANKPETLQRLRRIDTIPDYLDPAEFRAFLQKTLADWTAITNALDLRMDS